MKISLIVIGGLLGAFIPAIGAPFAYWLSGADFHRCQSLSELFVLTLFATLVAGFFGGLIGSEIADHMKGGAK